ncbi:hypothetical protein HYW41_05165 [Candidatus Daviesbacteria bacterium]|nr:hypothetical protein [Candidatus Daviesbacteria bacterium]
MSLGLERETDYGEQLAGEGGHLGPPDAIPQEINITETPQAVDPEQLRAMADKFLQPRPDITNRIIRFGQDAVALATHRGVMLYVGIGVASLAGIVGGVVIWQRLRRKDSTSE